MSVSGSSPPRWSATGSVRMGRLTTSSVIARRLSVGRLLRPGGRRVLKVLLPPIGGRVEEAIGVGERFGAARVRRIRVEEVVVEAEEDAQAVLLTLDSVAHRCFHFGLVPIV